MPAGETGGGQWTSSGSGSGRLRIRIFRSNPEDEAGGDGGMRDEIFVDEADGNAAFDSPAGSDDAFGSDDDSSWDDWLGRPGNATRDDKRPTRINDTRLASNENKPQLGRDSRIALFAELGRRLVQAFRSENGLFDFFNHSTGTVAHTKVDERDIFGSNSTSPTYYAQDRAAADRMRDILIEKYPEVMKADNVGHKPNDALYHAETNVLLRSASENGGTLAGRSVEIYVDRNICNSCEKVLPFVGLELGIPEIVVVDPRRVFTIMNGEIVSRRLR